MTSKDKITFIAAFILIIMTGIYFFGQYLLAGFNFTFFMDDPYIHLSIAKNFAEYGDWSLVAGEFQSVSSSPLYTLLISVFYYFNIGGEYVPFLLNTLAGFFVLHIIKIIAEKQNISNSLYSTVLLSVILITPLFYLIFVSMEHVLHLALIIYLVYSASKILSEKVYKISDIYLLSIVSGITGLVRYENLFFVAVIGVILLYRKKVKFALIFGIISILPLLIFGLISISNGGFLLPNSVLAKGVKSTGGILEILKYFVRPLKYLVLAPETGILLLTSLVYLYKKIKEKHFDTGYYFILITALLIYIHPMFAKFGWLGRYEAYLIGLSCVSFIWIIPFFKKHKNSKYILLVILAFLVFLRGVYMPLKYKHGMKNVYEQQYQIAQFVKHNYNDSTIVLNDIGAVSYYTDAKIIDLWALATTEFVEEIVTNGELNKNIVQTFVSSKDANTAITYGRDIFDYIPDNWQPVASWKIKSKDTPAHDIVYFYALGQNKSILRKQIEEYSYTKLPKEVEVKYY